MSAWTKVGNTNDFASNMGGCVKVNNKQIAVFNFKKNDSWFAVQNECPHKQQMVLSRGIMGDLEGAPKVACPLHKHAFCLKTGKHLSDGDISDLTIYPIKVENDEVFLRVD
ncbi:MAG: nitrite reductase small subunit NirD [Lentisphaeria bacterium]|nr:nitrite reductase small subunit NirD [Lentisphaeria bacterium]